MFKKRKIFIAGIFLLAFLLIAVLFIKHKWYNKAAARNQMVQRVENALGDDFKKQTKTEIVATMVYGNGNESNNINYHVLKTTYYEANPNDVTGLNVNALSVLFSPDTVTSCEEMKIQEWDAALYKTAKHCYLCWTYSPEISYVLEYNPDTISDQEIIKMAQSAKITDD